MVADKTGLTVFLLKESQVAAFETDLLKGTEAVQLQLVSGLDGIFLIFPMPPREPGWVAAVRNILDSPEALGVESQSPACLLVLRQGGRMYVITFGHAWMKLKDEWLEPEFGRRVALNVIPNDQLIEIRAEQVFAKWHLANERAPKASSVEEFAVEFDRDLVEAVEGISSDVALGRTIRGGTSLRVTVPIVDLPRMLDRSSVHFASDAYKRHWPEIDNLRPLNDQTVIASLEAQLDVDLASGNGAKKVIMFTPYQRQGDPVTVDSYVIGRMTKEPPKTPYLTFGAWESLLIHKQTSPSVSEAKKTPIHFLDDAGDEIGTRSIFHCFGYETALAGQQYVLSSGIWYEVVPAFLTRINNIVDKIPKPSIRLLNWNQVESEGDYNLRCATHDSALLHFDVKNIVFGGGQSRFEFCDLMHSKKRVLLFAKIVSKSSGMSHLVEQVRRTAELLFSADPGYRRELAKVFRKHHASANASWLNVRPRPGDFNMCLVSLGRTKQQLPFFSKCAMARLYEDLRERGHEVSFAKV